MIRLALTCIIAIGVGGIAGYAVVWFIERKS